MTKTESAFDPSFTTLMTEDITLSQLYTTVMIFNGLGEI
jgi:hypothetical protein